MPADHRLARTLLVLCHLVKVVSHRIVWIGPKVWPCSSRVNNMDILNIATFGNRYRSFYRDEALIAIEPDMSNRAFVVSACINNPSFRHFRASSSSMVGVAWVCSGGEV